MKTIPILKLSLLAGLLGSAQLLLVAAPPVVKTVPWVASNPLIPHDTWSGKTITLKGTSDSDGTNFEFWWDFGDGSPPTAVADITPTPTKKYALEATHAYTAPLGTVFTARLYVRNKTTGETGTKAYYVRIEPQSLPTEINVAIDEGLWYLHKTQTRSGSEGYWSGSGYPSQTAANVNAFEVNGHLESGSPDNPYTETVTRGMRYVFSALRTYAIGVEPLGNPDSNGNGYGVGSSSGRRFYEGGMFIDVIIASGTPDATAPTGVTSPGPGILGRKYKDIVQDMVDYYAAAQYDSASYGAWRYNFDDFPDNSASQWGAIGIIPAERNWGCVVPGWVKTANVGWLTYSQRADGVYGYTDSNPLSGVPFGTTPAGLVQCAMDGIGRGNPLWDKAETYLRDNFVNPTAYWHFKNNYYGMFSFVKAMLLHDANGDGVAEPLEFLQSSTPGVLPIDWYSAEVAAGDPTDGLARKIVNDQVKTGGSTGSWSGFGWFDTYGYTTAWSIIMLRRTLFEAGGPVAVAKANPNPAVAGQLIQLDGSDSFHQDATKLIDSWEWDLDNDGAYDDASGPFPTVSFPALGDYPVRLQVSDNGSPEKFANTVITIRVTIPPLAPTASAGGPYSLCLGATPWYLDATASTNPDEGQSEPGRPGDTIQSYLWDLDGDGQFDDASGPQPLVSGPGGFFEGKPPGSYLIQVRVTDTTATSFPSSGFGDLSDTDSTVVVVRASTDPACGCVDNLAARAKPGKVQLTWTHTGAHHYNVYRGTISGGPYLKIASTTSTYSTYLDYGVVNGTTYYYVVREANVLDEEACQSNQASATPRTR